MNKRKLFLAILILVAIGVGYWIYSWRTPGPRLTRLTVGLDFTVSGYHAPWFVAKDKGYFADEGLEVNINRGYGSGDTVRKLTTGVIDVGLAHPAPLVIAISEGAQLRIVMGYFANEMCSLYSFGEKGNVLSPKALEGKKWGGPEGDVCTILLRPLSEIAEFDYQRIRFINMDAPSRIPALVRGDIDVTGSFYDKDVLFEEAGKQANLSLVTGRYANWLQMYSNSVITSDRLIEENPQVVRGFVRALLRALEFTLENPEEAADVVMRNNPELDPAYVSFSVSILPDATRDLTAGAQERGTIDREKMNKTVETVVRYWNIKSPPDPASVYTNDFVRWAAEHLK